LHGQCFFYFGPHPDAFERVFKPVGWLHRPFV
jgi:hypothetical protein